MKHRMFKKLSQRLAVAGIFGLAFAFPVVSMAAQTVKLESAIGVANYTAGEKTYQASTSAKFDQVVKVEVYYHNTELPDSGKVANNLNVKINIPSQAGKTQTVTSKVSADNANTVTKSATVNLPDSTAYLQYIPGSAVWKHNVGTNSDVKIVETKISDNVVTSGSGLRLEDEKPCYNFAATVTVMARVMTPGVTITKQVEKANEDHNWSTANTANPGDVLKYKITYKNTGNTTENKVVIRDSLPDKMSLVPNTTYLYNATNPNGVLYKSDNITNGGIVIGDYVPGGIAYITFEVKMPTADQLQCGATTFTNVGVARPEGMNEYYNTAKTTTNRQCMAPGVLYVCKAFDVTVDNTSKTVTISKLQTAQKNATFTKAVIDWGDGSQALTTDKPVGKSHQYNTDSFTVTATAHFNAGGKDVTANCAKSGSFVAPATPTTPGELPHTGPGQVFGLFGAVTAAGAVAHRWFAVRRFARR